MPVDDAAAGARHLRLRLSPDVDAPAAARRALRTLPLGETANDVLLLASELVTNAVLHAGLSADQVIELDADCEAGGATRVTVRDHGRGFQPGGPANGNGLLMMAALTPDWGVAQDGETRVWFEVRR